MARFDHKTFFDGYRREFGRLSQSQVAALGFLLDEFERDSVWKNLKHIAYALATIKRETGDTYEPITEYGGRKYFDKYDTGRLARNLGNTPDADGDGYKFRGRGYVQITGRNNYRNFGIEQNPELALDPQVAFEIMSTGMFHGSFTGKKLTEYINGDKCDYTNARRVINGTDKAAMIAGYAKDFEKILTDSAASPAVNRTEEAFPPEPATPSPQNPPEIETPPILPTPPPEKVAVEKEDLPPPHENYAKRKWKQITGWFGTVGGLTALKENADTVSTVTGGWKPDGVIISYLIIGVLAAFVLWFAGGWIMEKIVRPLRARWLTTSLISANRTDTNQVIVASPDKLDELEKQGYIIIRRS